MANWVTMSGLGFVMETMFLWLGMWFPFFLLFWVIINVSEAVSHSSRHVKLTHFRFRLLS